MRAFIPAKALSVRLPGKNLLPFGDGTLLSHKIKQLADVSGLDEIVVSSDSSEILDIALSLGCTAVRRPQEFADGSATFSEFVEYVCDLVGSDHLLWACVTSPFADAKLFEKAISTYLSQLENGFESLVTVYNFRHHIFSNNGPVNFSIGPGHPDSQDLAPIKLFTNGVVLAHTDKMKLWRDHFNSRPYLLEVSQIEAIDIDTFLDYQVALSTLSLVSSNSNSDVDVT